MKRLFTLNDPPYGTERCHNGCCHVWTAPFLQGLMSCKIDRYGV